MKPGIQSTEFWGMMMPFILAIGVLVLIGLGRADADLLSIVLGLLGLGGSYASGQYTKSRTDVKTAVIEAAKANN